MVEKRRRMVEDLSRMQQPPPSPSAPAGEGQPKAGKEFDRKTPLSRLRFGARVPIWQLVVAAIVVVALFAVIGFMYMRSHPNRGRVFMPNGAVLHCDPLVVKSDGLYCTTGGAVISAPPGTMYSFGSG
jgi:hypothetical protein